MIGALCIHSQEDPDRFMRLCFGSCCEVVVEHTRCPVKHVLAFPPTRPDILPQSTFVLCDDNSSLGQSELAYSVVPD